MSEVPVRSWDLNTVKCHESKNTMFVFRFFCVDQSRSRRYLFEKSAVVRWIYLVPSIFKKAEIANSLNGLPLQRSKLGSRS